MPVEPKPLSRWIEVAGQRREFGMRIARTLSPTNPSKVWQRYCGFYLARGRLTFMDEHGERTDLEPGCFGQHLPGRFHDIRRQPDADCEEWALMADRELFEHLQQVGLMEADAAICRPGPGIADAWHATWGQLADPTLSASQALVAWLGLIQVMRQHPQQPVGIGHHEALLRRAADDLAADLLAEVDLSALAADLGWSYAHFRRCFRQRYGLAPDAWRTRERLRQARYLLRENGLSVEAAATAIGFATPFAFSRAYKRQWGTAPSQDR